MAAASASPLTRKRSPRPRQLGVLLIGWVTAQDLHGLAQAASNGLPGGVGLGHPQAALSRTTAWMLE